MGNKPWPIVKNGRLMCGLDHNRDHDRDVEHVRRHEQMVSELQKDQQLRCIRAVTIIATIGLIVWMCVDKAH